MLTIFKNYHSRANGEWESNIKKIGGKEKMNKKKLVNLLVPTVVSGWIPRIAGSLFTLILNFVFFCVHPVRCLLSNGVHLCPSVVKIFSFFRVSVVILVFCVHLCQSVVTFLRSRLFPILISVHQCSSRISRLLSGLRDKSVVSFFRVSVVILFFCLTSCLFVVPLFAEDAEIKLNSANGTTGMIIQDSDSTQVLRADSDGNLVIKGTMTVFGLASVPQFVINSAGNLGIGTPEPFDRTLNVNGGMRLFENGTYNGGLLYGFNTGNNIASFTFRDKTNLNYNDVLMESKSWYFLYDGNQRIGLVINSSGTVKLAENSYPGSGMYTMIVSSSGNVGIGTTSPGAKLEVVGGSITVRGVDTQKDIFALGSQTGDYKVVVSTSGNVGIGTTNPVEKLVIQCAGGSQDGIRFTDGTKMVSMFVNSLASTLVGAESNDDLGIMTNSSVRMTIKNTGNIGIGTTSPTSKLTVETTAGTIGSLLKVSTGTTNVFEVNASSVAMQVGLVLSGSGNSITFPDGTKQITASAGSGKLLQTKFVKNLAKSAVVGPVDVDGSSTTITTTNGTYLLIYVSGNIGTPGGTTTLRINVDNVNKTSVSCYTVSTTLLNGFGMSWIEEGLSAGSHTVKLVFEGLENGYSKIENVQMIIQEVNL